MTDSPYALRPIGHVESPLVDRDQAPKQGDEGSPDAWLVFDPDVADGPVALRAGTGRVGATWLDRSSAAVPALNPRSSSLGNPDTIRRVQAAARELRYQPNAIARGLKTARSMSVGVLLPDLTNPLFPPIVRGIEDVLAADGYTTLIANTDNDPDRQTAAFETLRARQVDGFIVATAHREDSLFTEAHRAGVTIVLVNRRLDRT